ncbi:MAG: hypothetical protein MJZ99_10665 [Bacteroidales bacterium]|nr:hypothetical protein [Bacteroidales bacterium]
MADNIRTKIKKMLPNLRVAKFFLFYFDSAKQKKVNRQMDLFLGKDASPKLRAWHRRRMCQAYVRDGWSFKEYFYYHYWLLSKKGRKEFVVETEKNKFCNKMHVDNAYRIFYNKIKSYEHFSKFYHREVYKVKSLSSDLEGLRDFVSRHPRYIVKPVGGTSSGDIYMAEGMDLAPLQKILDKYKGGAIAEELIVQGEPLATIYSGSVNTIRVASMLVNGEPQIIGAAIRFGRGGAFIDNASQGGVAGAIDLDTGIVTHVCDKLGHTFVVHPDTQKPIVGLQIPEWESAKQMVKEMSTVIPTCRYVGWDLAYSTNGWVMVEGNSLGQMGVLQIPTQKGIRSRLLSLDPDCLTF